MPGREHADRLTSFRSSNSTGILSYSCALLSGSPCCFQTVSSHPRRPLSRLSSMPRRPCATLRVVCRSSLFYYLISSPVARRTVCPPS